MISKSIFPIKTMLGPDGFRREDDDYTQIKNPITDELGMHLGGVVSGPGWEGKGGVVKVHLFDDRGGGFVLCLGEHKGAVYAWLEDVRMEGGPE